MVIHLLAPRDLENQRAQWLIFKGKAPENPSYRPMSLLHTKMKLKMLGRSQECSEKDEHDFPAEMQLGL